MWRALGFVKHLVVLSVFHASLPSFYLSSWCRCFLCHHSIRVPSATVVSNILLCYTAILVFSIPSATVVSDVPSATVVSSILSPIIMSDFLSAIVMSRRPMFYLSYIIYTIVASGVPLPTSCRMYSCLCHHTVSKFPAVIVVSKIPHGRK